MANPYKSNWLVWLLILFFNKSNNLYGFPSLCKSINTVFYYMIDNMLDWNESKYWINEYIDWEVLIKWFR